MPAPYLPILLTRTQDDTDALAILAAITSAGVTPTTAMVNAAHYFVSASKWAGLWTKFVAVYGLMGGTAACHSINWKTPGTYNVTWNGGVTHSANGFVGNGTTGYGDTGLNPRSVLSGPTNAHLSVYARTNANVNEVEVGCYTTGTDCFYMYTNNGQTCRSFIGDSSAPARYPVIPNPLPGFFVGYRSSVTLSTLLGRNRKITATTSIGSATLANRNMWIGGLNSATGNYYSSKNISFASIGTVLTDQNAKDLSFIVQSTQNILSRAV